MKISKILILSAAALSLAACGEHTHSFGEAWKSDETSHWHECECGEKSDKANHLDTNTDGKCDVCNHDMEVPGPTPSGGEVTKEEWMASIGMEKPFLFADNYKFNMLGKVNGVDFAEENFYADGNKFKDEPVKAPDGEKLGTESYYSFENSKYVAYQFTGGKWSTHETSSTPIHSIIQTSLAPFGNPDLFTYDETSKSYKCETTTMGVTFTNLEIKFVEKKITKTTFTAEGADYICSLTYGGQTVTLPDIPQPSSNEVTSSEWVAAFGVNKPYYIADNYKMDVEMDAGGQTMATTIWVDDLKLKALQTQGIGADETYYNEIVDGQKYQYQFDEGTSKWTKNETSRSIADDFANYLEPFGASYTSFTFDNVAETYKCSSLSFGGHLFTNLSIKFENKQIAEISLSSVMEDEGRTPFTMTFEITYGGQTVTLPEIDPEPAQGMTEDEFNALVNKAYSKGFSFKTSTPQADCISSTIIFDCVNKNLYISENWKDEDFIGITVYFDSVVYFKSPMTGEWQEPRQLSSEELETQFNAGLAEYLMQILPTTDFSDFTFNPEDGTYEVTMNLSPYEGVEITMVYVYVMDANGITSISGTTTYVYGGETQTSTVSIYDVDIGEQEITPPEVEKKEVNYTINNSMTWENAFGLKKGYYFFNTNYKATLKITTAVSEENYVFTVDLLNLKYELTTNNYGVEKYYSIEDNKYYEYSLDNVSNLWSKERCNASNFPIMILRNLIINPFQTNFSSFNYDETIKSYKCQTLTYNNQEFKNVILHFEDSSLMSASFESFYDDAGKTPFSATFSIVYGGQTVVLPQVE